MDYHKAVQPTWSADASNSPVNLPTAPIMLNIGSFSGCTINFYYGTPPNHWPKTQCTQPKQEPDMPEVSEDYLKAILSDFWLTIIYLYQ